MWWSPSRHIPIAVDAQNEDQIWLISYGEYYQGLITINEHEVEGPYFTLFSAMINSFTCGKYSILILGCMIALLHGLDSNFYFFDPHARNSAGMPDFHGTAVLTKYTSISEFQTASRLDKARECMKQKRGAETTSQKQSRLENARNYQKQKRAQETLHERQTRLGSARKYRKHTEFKSAGLFKKI